MRGWTEARHVGLDGTRYEVFVADQEWGHACCGRREWLPVTNYPQVSPCPYCAWREDMSEVELREHRRELERTRAFLQRIREQMDWS